MLKTRAGEIVGQGPAITRNATAAVLGVTPRYVDMLWRDPDKNFPRPFYVGRQLRFIADEVLAWRETRRASRPQARAMEAA